MTDFEQKKLFQEIENKLNRAYEENDVSKIRILLSEQWTILESSTGLSNKEQFVTAIESGKLVHTKMIKEVQEVKQFDNFAIVISKGKNEGQYLDTPYNSEQWITNIYTKVAMNWICVMTIEVPANCGNP
ncbi:MAG: nuclear transport factor 2 family protein [Agriterribacter sp.]